MSYTDYKDRHRITEDELMPIKSDDAAMFASDEDVMKFHHFYQRGQEETIAKIEKMISDLISDTKSKDTSKDEKVFVDGRISGLQSAARILKSLETKNLDIT